MIYLDNSATTFPKPRTVQLASAAAIRNSANPGRSGHKLSLAAGQTIYNARLAAAKFFGTDDETRVIFTPGCTWSLNTAIIGLLSGGGHAVVSELEHNAVMRPLKALADSGVTFSAAKVYPGDDDRTVDSFRRSINVKTKAVICTHASNVWGIRLPVERICALAHAYGLHMVVDAAQSAGVLPLSMKDGYDIVCAAGHKGLYGPMGTGLMLLSDNADIPPLITGGTGSNSASLIQPSELPDRFESGTPNVSGIAGLAAGIGFVNSKGRDKIFRHEMSLIRYAWRALSEMQNVRLYTPEPIESSFAPVLSFNIDKADSEDTAQALSGMGIAVRAGLHCSSAAHIAAGTIDTGAVRLSPGAFTSLKDMERTTEAIRLLSRRKQ